MVQHLNVFLVVRGPKLNTVLEVWPHQCQVQGHDHLPTPAVHTIPDVTVMFFQQSLQKQLMVNVNNVCLCVEGKEPKPILFGCEGGWIS